MRELTIDGRLISDDRPCYIIAEIGNNHGGSAMTAGIIIEEMAAAGVDACKLQKRSNATLYTAEAYDAPYAHEHSFGPTYGAHREALELTLAGYQACQDEANAMGIALFATAFDEAAADFLMRLEVPAIKIASGDLTNTPLIRYCARFGVPLIVSTGGGTIDDIDRAMEACGSCPRAILHCTASYPLAPVDANLAVIPALRARYPETVIGWSSHSPGLTLSYMAYGLGARILEQHVTLNRASKGSDHGFSLEPQGVRKLVEDLAQMRAALGSPVKQRLACETEPLWKMAKALYAAHDLSAGHILRDGDLARKSPADGLPPYMEPSIIGRRLMRPLAKDEAITDQHLA